jgi:hypothetical protein
MPVIGSNQETIKEYLGPDELSRLILGNTIVQGAPPTYISASGGTLTTFGPYKIHTFTSTGSSTFTVHQLASDEPELNNIEYLIVGGGGGGGARRFDIGPSLAMGGGGGAGGVMRTGSLNASTGSFTITVGRGGDGATRGSGAGDFAFQGLEGFPGISSSAFNVSASGGGPAIAPVGGGSGRGTGGSNADFTGGASSNNLQAAGGGAGAGQNGQNAGDNTQPGSGGSGSTTNGSTGGNSAFSKLIAEGGEGFIYKHSSGILKIYKDPTNKQSKIDFVYSKDFGEVLGKIKNHISK